MKPTAILCWLLILAICILVPIGRAAVAKRGVEQESPSEVDIQTRVMSRYLVGAGKLIPSQARQLLSDFERQPHVGESNQIAAAVVIGEVDGREKAAARLLRIHTPAAEEFLRVYASDSRSVDLSNQRARFGWFADLAQSFGKSDADASRAGVIRDAKRTFLIAVFALIVLAAAAIVGFGLFITAIVLVALGKLRFAVGRPIGSAAVYVEAFTIYILGIIGVGLLIGWLFPHAPLGSHVVAMLAIIGIALGWPTVRGVLWSEQKRDWGIHADKGIFLEALCGIGGYLAGLPVIAIGILLTLVLLKYSGATATHPIVQQLDMSPIFLLGIAAVFAPLTEELLFRGAFVSHLRAGVGIVLGALISGVIFAAIHPQGWAAIPALASIGVVLAMIRQWRGSLVPSIVAHAMHNGLLLGTVLLMIR